MPADMQPTLNNDPATRANNYTLRRREVIARILADRPKDLLIVVGLGTPSFDIVAAGDTDLTFHLWGAMGSAISIGIGLAQARPQNRVLVTTGDGEMLMGLGSLATAMVHKPANLTVVVTDNERYGATGMQTTHTAYDVNVPEMARAAGWPITGTVTSAVELETAVPNILRAPGPVFYAIKVRAEEDGMLLPPKDGVMLRDRFRKALLGPSAIF
jgi:thiamine pyrophosphate-dependent acetolactate synthase large subunit-like protein